MRRLAWLMALGLSIALTNSASAQPGRGKGPPSPPSGGGNEEIRKLQGELDRLQEAIRDVEARLKKARDTAAAPRKDERRPEGPPFGKGPGGFGPPGWYGKGPGGPPAPTAQAKKPTVEDRLDKIEKTLEDLSRELRRGKR